MYDIHCDECGKKIDRDKDSYYTIEVTREIPLAKYRRVKLQGQDNEYEVNESWTTLRSIEFCDECWEKVGFKKYLK